MRLFVIVFLAGSASENAMASGSSYSLYGIGDIMMTPNTRSLGMGGVIAPLWSTLSIIPDNPASWCAIRQTMLQGSLDYDVRSSQSLSNSGFFAESSINGATLGFPIYTPMGIAIVTGFSPLSEVNYNVNYSTPQPTPDSNTTYSTQYQGQGGLSTFFLGGSVAPFDWLALGGAFEYNFGSIIYSALGNFSTYYSSSGYAPTAIYNKSSPDGFDGRFSAIISLGDFTLGGIIRLPATLKTQFSQTYTAPVTVTDTSSTIYYNQTLPASYDVGISYRIKEFLLATEYSAGNWNSLLIDGSHPGNIQSDYRISIGVERTGSLHRSASFFDRLSYRFGGYFWKTYYYINGTPINEFFTTVGAGIPVGQNGNLDLALQYGTEGTTNAGLIKENIFRFNLTFNFGEFLGTRLPGQ